MRYVALFLAKPHHFVWLGIFVTTNFEGYEMVHKLSVLVVDDNAINRLILGNLLKKYGAAVEEACNGKEALFLAIKKDYDIIFMDIQMPVMDGLESFRRIRALPEPKSCTPIIAVTADSIQIHIERYRNEGFDDILFKPINFAKIIALLAFYRGLKSLG